MPYYMLISICVEKWRKVMEFLNRIERGKLTSYSLIVEIFKVILFGIVGFKIFYVGTDIMAYNNHWICYCFSPVKFSVPKFWSYEIDFILDAKDKSIYRINENTIMRISAIFLLISLLALIAIIVNRVTLKRAKENELVCRKEAYFRIAINSLSLISIIVLMIIYPTFFLFIFMLPLIFEIVLALTMIDDKFMLRNGEKLWRILTKQKDIT